MYNNAILTNEYVAYSLNKTHIPIGELGNILNKIIWKKKKKKTQTCSHELRTSLNIIQSEKDSA
jgi:hypothetical protein